jgi:hypothetical protein
MSTDIRTRIKNVLCGPQPSGFSIFCTVKEGGLLKLKKFLVDDALSCYVREMIFTVIEEKFIADDAVYDDIENAVDDRNVIYVVEQTEQYAPFHFLQEPKVQEGFTEKEKDTLSGFIFKFNLNEDVIWAYQQVYSTSISKQKKGAYVILKDKIFTKTSDNLFKIDQRVDALIVDRYVCPQKVSFLERSFGLDKLFRQKAQKILSNIESMNIIDDMSKILEFSTHEGTSNSKKLAKVKGSPVFSMPQEELIQKLRTLQRYRHLKIENGKIKVTSKNDVLNIIKMLNDDFLKSDLTEAEYDSSSKIILQPVHETH